MSFNRVVKESACSSVRSLLLLRTRNSAFTPQKKSPRTSKKTFRARSQSGQAIVEYILLLTIVLGGVGFFLQKLTGSFDKMTAGFGGKIETQIRTGSLPAGVWTK